MTQGIGSFSPFIPDFQAPSTSYHPFGFQEPATPAHDSAQSDPLDLFPDDLSTNVKDTKKIDGELTEEIEINLNDLDGMLLDPLAFLANEHDKELPSFSALQFSSNSKEDISLEMEIDAKIAAEAAPPAVSPPVPSMSAQLSPALLATQLNSSSSSSSSSSSTSSANPNIINDLLNFEKLMIQVGFENYRLPKKEAYALYGQGFVSFGAFDQKIRKGRKERRCHLKQIN